jgi:hypothetical protein
MGKKMFTWDITVEYIKNNDWISYEIKNLLTFIGRKNDII